MLYSTARGQWALHLLLYTASLPVGSGLSSFALPYYLWVVSG